MGLENRVVVASRSGVGGVGEMGERGWSTELQL